MPTDIVEPSCRKVMVIKFQLEAMTLIRFSNQMIECQLHMTVLWPICGQMATPETPNATTLSLHRNIRTHNCLSIKASAIPIIEVVRKRRGGLKVVERTSR